MPKPEDLERRLDYRFTDSRLLRQALTHRSFSADHSERLEFLGDGVLECVMSEALYGRFPTASEGDLTRLRSNLVRAETLSNLARKLQLGELMSVGVPAKGSGIDSGPTPAMLADALEAVFGAVFVDGGYDAARKAVLNVFGRIMDTIDPRYIGVDAKTTLNELMQSKQAALPQYRIVSSASEAQNHTFEIECLVTSLGLTTRGQGTSRQRAEQVAAAAMLKLIEQ